MIGSANQEAHARASRSIKPGKEILRELDADGIRFPNDVTVAGVKIRFTDGFSFRHGRAAVIAAVGAGASPEVAVYYNSRSQGSIRLLPAVDFGDHFSKGVLGEHSIEAPLELEMALFPHLKATKTTARGLVLSGLVPRLPSMSDYSSVPKLGNLLRLHSRRLLSRTTATLPRAEVSGTPHPVFPEPADLKLDDLKDQPEFSSKPLHTYERDVNGKAGAAIGEVYRAPSGLLFAIGREKATNRIWIQKVEDATAPINPLGLRSRVVDPGHLTLPLWERPEDAPAGYVTGKQEGEYQCTWAYLKQIPLVRSYYASKGQSLPD